jgi:hypothetical protein
MKQALLLAALWCAFTLYARADVIGSALDNGDGTFTYSYVLDNSSGTFDLTGFTLEFPIPTASIDWNQLDLFSGGDVSVPSIDWIADAGIPVLGGQSAQDFFSIAFTGDVPVGQKLEGFGFTSSLPPATTALTIEYGAAGENVEGITIGPTLASVPDSGATALLICISSLFCAASVRCKRS